MVATWEVLVARRPRLERHHAVAITDDALKAAIVLTDRFVTDRARPDKAIDVLDEACAHAQATAHVSAGLERLIRERRRLDALLRRDLPEEDRSSTDDVIGDLVPVIERIGAELDRFFGRVASEPAPAAPAATARDSLAERHAVLDAELRRALERQGVTVGGAEVARVVGAAVGKTIEWAG